MHKTFRLRPQPGISSDRKPPSSFRFLRLPKWSPLESSPLSLTIMGLIFIKTPQCIISIQKYMLYYPFGCIKYLCTLFSSCNSCESWPAGQPTIQNGGPVCLKTKACSGFKNLTLALWYPVFSRNVYYGIYPGIVPYCECCSCWKIRFRFPDFEWFKTAAKYLMC